MNDAQIWSTIGVLAATLLGALGLITTMFTRTMNAGFDMMGAKFDALEARLGSRIDRVESRLDGVESRLDGVESRIRVIETKLDGLDGDVRALFRRVFPASD